MSTNSSDVGPAINNGRVAVPPIWGGTPQSEQPLPPSSSIPALAPERIDYTLRAIVRHDTLGDALRVGRQGEHTPVPGAMIEAGQDLHALVWDACDTCFRRHGHLGDRELLYLTACELLASPDYAQVTTDELQGLINYCYEGDAPDATAGRQAVARVLEHYLADAVEALAWADWDVHHDAPPRQVLADVQQTRQAIEDFRAGADRRGPYSTVQFRERVQARVEIITGVLVANQLGVFGAQTKTLKTLLGMDAAISIGTGTCWLNHEYWACLRPLRVGFFSAESGAETLLHKHDVIAASKRYRLPLDQHEAFNQNLATNLYWDDQVPDLSDPSSVDRLRQTIIRNQLSVVFVDPLSMAIGSAAKDLSNMAVGGQVILNAAHICRQAGCTLILIHHTSGDRQRQTNNRAYSPIDLTDIAYTAISNHARQWITISRAAAYDEQTRRNDLWMRIGGSGLQAGGTFRILITEGYRHELWDPRVATEVQAIERVQSEREHTEREEDRADRNRVLRYIEQNPGATVSGTKRGGHLPGIGAVRLQGFLNDLQSHHAVRHEDFPGNVRRWHRVEPTQGDGAGAAGGNHVNGE